MNILIVGAGKVGEALIENLSKEKHDIIVVDEKIELVEKLVDTYDIIGTVGNGASYDVLINAKIQKADMLIAVTNSDEINMLCCIIGKKLGVKDTIARVRNPEYSLQLDLLQQEMGIDMVINPEFEAANDIFRMLQFPSASNVESFAKGRVNIVEFASIDTSRRFCAAGRGRHLCYRNHATADTVLQTTRSLQKKCSRCAYDRRRQNLLLLGKKIDKTGNPSQNYRTT